MLLSRVTAIVLAALGVFMLAIALFLMFATFHGATVAEWSSLCRGVIGQIGQAFSSGARADCALADTAETAKGWLFWLGVALLLVSIIVGAVAAQARPASPRPAFVPGMPPVALPPVASIPPQPPALPVQFPPQPVPSPPPSSAAMGKPPPAAQLQMPRPVPEQSQPQALPSQPPPSVFTGRSLPQAAPVQSQIPRPDPGQQPPSVLTESQTQPLVPPGQALDHLGAKLNREAPVTRSPARWERLIWPATAVAVVAILTAGGVLAARELNSSALGTSSPLHALACTAPAIRCASGGMQSQPAEITISADGSASVQSLHWSGWGSANATAAGVLEEDNCTPNCAQGTYTSYSATVTLSGLRPYGSGEAYATMRVTSPSAPYQPTFRNLVPGHGGA